MNKERREAYIAWGLVALGIFVYVSLIFNNNIWLDEGFTAHLVNTNMAGVLERSMNDTLPPIYNIILKIMTDIFGYRIPVMKLTSVIPMILTMILSATVVRKRFSAVTSYFFILALIVMPNMMYYGVEIRMYSLGFFFATASGVFAYEALCDSGKKNWILFTLFSVLAGYSHHFAFVTVGFVYLFLLIYYFFFERNNIKRWLLCLLATFVLYLPCLIVTISQIKSVSGYFSMPEVTTSVFIKYSRFPYTVGCTPVTILLAIFMIVLLVLFGLKKDKSLKHWYAFSCFLIYYGVLVFGTVVSKIMTANIFVDRYLFFSFGLLWLFPAIMLGSMDKDQEVFRVKARSVVMLALLFEIVIGACSYYQEYRIEYSKGCDELIAYLEQNVTDGDVLLTDEVNEELMWCLRVYAPTLTYCESIEEAESMANGNSGNIWLAENIDMGDNYSYQGMKLECGRIFNFDRYEFKLFRIEQ